MATTATAAGAAAGAVVVDVVGFAVVVVAPRVVVVGGVVVVVVVVVVVGAAVTVKVPRVSDDPSHVAVTWSVSGGLPGGTVRLVLTGPSGTVVLVLVVEPFMSAITIEFALQVTVPLTLKLLPGAPLFGLMVALPDGADAAGDACTSNATIPSHSDTTPHRIPSHQSNVVPILADQLRSRNARPLPDRSADESFNKAHSRRSNVL